MNKTEQDQLKKEAAIKAAKMVEPNSVLGVGTGSTVAFFIDALGERKEKEGFSLKHIVTTSNRSKKQLEGLGFKVDELADIDQADLTVDGADRVDDNLDGIKGGGGALTLEMSLSTQRRLFGLLMNQNLFTISAAFRFQLKYYQCLLNKTLSVLKKKV